MPRVAASGSSPNWDRLYEVAAAQAGYLSLVQALEAGYSRQLLQHYVKERRLERAGRAVYRIVHYPTGENEDLVPLWLWSKQVAIFSHETALLLHHLSDALPGKRHMTLPTSWNKRRLRAPKGVVLHFADIPKKAITWLGPVPLTTPLRTIADCVADHVAVDLVRQAEKQGVRRGFFERAEIAAAIRGAKKRRD